MFILIDMTCHLMSHYKLIEKNTFKTHSRLYLRLPSYLKSVFLIQLVKAC